jgi:phage terminase Nu1 subunit (DNA packaging protein)
MTTPTVIGERQISEDRWVSEPELRYCLDYSSSTIRRLRKRGLPCVGRDRLRRYHLGTVLQWLSEHA